MKIALLNSALLPFLLLAAAPLLVHLFAKGKPPVHAFSSVEFISRILKSALRLKRPQDYLLLALRTLFAAALVSLFLLPVLFSSGASGQLFQRSNVVVVVDATASMACVEGAQTRFAAACAEASELISGLGGRDSANVVWLDSRPSSVFPEMGVNFAYLKDSLRKAKVSSEVGRIGDSVRLACGMLKGLEGRKQVCIVSDFQSSAWSKAVLDVPRDVELVKVKVGSLESPNLAVSSLRCEPARPLAGEEAVFYCQIDNFSSQSRRTTVFFNVQETRVSREIALPPRGSGTLMFKSRFASHGVFAAKASISEDSFPGDDSRSLCVEVAQSLRVGILPDDKPTAEAWKRALDALSWARAETISASDLANELPYDVIMLAGWSGEGAAGIAGSLKRGAAVVCMPAGKLELSKILALAGDTSGSAASQGAVRFEASEGQRRGLKIVAPKDPAFKLFSAGDCANPVAGAFTGRLLLPKLPKEAEALVAFDDGEPALARIQGRGSLFIWAMPLGRELSSMQAQPGFLPFLSELLLSSRSEAAASAESPQESFPGDSLCLKPGKDALLADVSVRDEAGAEIPVELRKDASGASFFVTKPVLKTGLYFWKDRGRDSMTSSVNFPSVESDLSCLSAEEAVKTSDAVAVSKGGDVKRMRDGVDLWPLLLLGCLLLLLLEGSCSLWAERT